ncbi:hypothetical protein SLEP1_g45173 [Rubroshorea leprosula]|uniref:AAA+ ATPase domain-containing protein n=1 Tax=Rubroshorea leprosula TaxID=152421 RepID=A0AAV5LIY2_9ROSI|nr:hypothetical protein SLEP1_g45173 [Rubroshorea leprosula]
MADAGLILITPLMPEALSKATSIAAQVSFAPVLQKQLAGLAQSLTEIQDVARGAEQRQESDAAIRLWLQKLNDAVYDAVDLLDKCDYGILVLQKEVQTSIQRLKQVHAFFSMAKKFKLINYSLAEIRKVVPFINLIIQVGGQNSATAGPYYQMVRLLDSSKVVGREDDVSKIVNLLNYQKTQHPISGISIVGMPGVGKTTVAGSVYMKAKEEKLYDVVAWVCVSEDFDHQRILGELLECCDVHPNKNNTTDFSSKKNNNNTTDALLHDLGHQLENKTFLLILDDVRERDPHNWSVFASSFSKIVKTNGNSTVLTTRCESVASVLEKQFPICRYDLQSLSDDECLGIIEKVVLRSSANALISSKDWLPLVAKQCGGLPLVAKQCGGLPSVASAIGGTWGNQFECTNNTVLSVLKMSFFNCMPSTLKKCFSYCSIFPKGFDIRKDNLIQLWMAGGFLQQISYESPMTTEDIGNVYFNELVSNSLFQDVRRDACGNVESCKMRDMVHDLALAVSKGETLIWENGSNIDETSTIRNLRIKYDGLAHPPIPTGISQRLHSLFLEGEFTINMESDLKSLRSLKLVRAKTEVLLASLRKLKQLKYLEIAESKIETLPGSFSELYLLQTLKVMQCSHLQKLPDDTSQLVSLRHLYVDNKKLLPKQIGRLTSLQSLPSFFVGTDEGFTIEELGGLSQLKGKLEIHNLEHVTSKSKATGARLNEKTELYDLKFVWENGRRATNINDEEVLEGLQPHSNLKSLRISNYMGKNFPSWMNGVEDSSASSLLDNLVRLELSSCSECMCIPSLGLLPSLQVLYICGMNMVRDISHEWLGGLTNLKELRMGPFWSNLEEFPGLSSIHDLHASLESLSLEGWDKLNYLPDELQHLTALKKLNISRFGSLEDLPQWLENLHSLQELKIEHCHQLKGQPSLQDMRLRGLDNLNSFDIVSEESLSTQRRSQHLSISLSSATESTDKEEMHLPGPMASPSSATEFTDQEKVLLSGLMPSPSSGTEQEEVHLLGSMPSASSATESIDQGKGTEGRIPLQLRSESTQRRSQNLRPSTSPSSATKSTGQEEVLLLETMPSSSSATESTDQGKMHLQGPMLPLRSEIESTDQEKLPSPGPMPSPSSATESTDQGKCTERCIPLQLRSGFTQRRSQLQLRSGFTQRRSQLQLRSGFTQRRSQILRNSLMDVIEPVVNIVKDVVPTVKKYFKYQICHNDYVNKFKEMQTQLNHRRQDVEEVLHAQLRQPGKIAKKEVEAWLEKAHQETTEKVQGEKYTSADESLVVDTPSIEYWATVFEEKQERLKHQKEDVEANLKTRRMQPGKIARKEVEEWLEKAGQQIGIKVEGLINQGGCSSLSNLRRKIEELRQILEQGKEFTNAAVILGDKVTRIAVSGMGGVSKTTIMKNVHNQGGWFSLSNLRRKIEKLRQILEQGKEFTNPAVISVRDDHPIKGFPLLVETCSGRDDIQEKILEWLKGDKVTRIAVSGMGGVGKTTIMKNVHNQLLIESKFENVIWVTVSKDFNITVQQKMKFDILQFQKKIASSLKLERELDHENETKLAALISQRLGQGSFLLILDDVWEPFSLEDVGISNPVGNNGCKLVLTTRSKDVARAMDCNVIHVNPLPPEEALELFSEKIGSDVFSDGKIKRDIEPFLKQILQKCDGVPLAIVTVAKSMKGKLLPHH